MDMIDIPFSFQELEELGDQKWNGNAQSVHEKLVAGRDPKIFVSYLSEPEAREADVVIYMLKIWNSTCCIVGDIDGLLQLGNCFLKCNLNVSEEVAFLAINIAAQDISYGFHEGYREVEDLGRQLFDAWLPATERESISNWPTLLPAMLAHYGLPQEMVLEILESKP